MKRFSFKIIISFFFASFTLTSCKDYLEVTPLSVGTEQGFFKTRQDAILATNACYSSLADIFRGGLLASSGQFWLFTEVMADDATDPIAVAIDNLTYDAANNDIFLLWSRHYTGIARCNTLLNRIKGIPMEESLKNRLQLEARFLRAYYYFNLVRLFGDVPLVLEEVTTLNASLPKRASVSEVYNQIIADLTAAEDLPISYSSDDIGRATRGAAKALLAKVYLTQKNWQQAAAKAKEVIDLGVYRLIPNYSDNFKVDNRNNPESVFEVQYARGPQVGGNLSFTTNTFFQQFAPAGSGANVTGISGTNGEGRMVPTNTFVNNAYEPNDPRKNASVRTFYTTSTGGKIDTVRVNYTIKYLDPKAIPFGALLSSANGSENNWRLIRYADVLLMYAEALNELRGGSTEALEAVNQVRRRARGNNETILPDLVNLNQIELRQAIYRERRVELAFEGHRWFDLVRTGTAIEVLGKFVNIQPRNLLLPIPQREIDLNPNLTQNPGY